MLKKAMAGRRFAVANDDDDDDAWEQDDQEKRAQLELEDQLKKQEEERKKQEQAKTTKNVSSSNAPAPATSSSSADGSKANQKTHQRSQSDSAIQGNTTEKAEGLPRSSSVNSLNNQEIISQIASVKNEINTTIKLLEKSEHAYSQEKINEAKSIIGKLEPIITNKKLIDIITNLNVSRSSYVIDNRLTHIDDEKDSLSEIFNSKSFQENEKTIKKIEKELDHINNVLDMYMNIARHPSELFVRRLNNVE